MRKIIALLVVIAILGIAGFVGQKFYISSTNSTLKLQISGLFNPATDSVSINGKNPELTSTKPFSYTFTSRPGSYKLTMAGPFIEVVEKQIEQESGKEADLTLETTTLSVDQIARRFIQNQDSIQKILYFSNYWIVVRTADNELGDINTVLKYNFTAREWQKAIEGEKINLSFIRSSDAPTELIEYLENYAGD